MSNLMLFFALLISAAMISAAIMAVWPARSTAVAILAAGAVGLFASIMFLLLAAPDVAMTEAAIGSGLTTFLFFFVLGRVRGGEDD